jgi:hypothetical protein
MNWDKIQPPRIYLQWSNSFMPHLLKFPESPKIVPLLGSN